MRKYQSCWSMGNTMGEYTRYIMNVGSMSRLKVINPTSCKQWHQPYSQPYSTILPALIYFNLTAVEEWIWRSIVYVDGTSMKIPYVLSVARWLKTHCYSRECRVLFIVNTGVLSSQNTGHTLFAMCSFFYIPLLCFETSSVYTYLSGVSSYL